MNAVIKISPTNIIMEYVNSRVLPPTRSEIIKGTGLSAPQVRKATNDMVNKGKLSVDYDNHGIATYSTKKMAKVTPKIVQVTQRPAWKEDNLQKPATAAWATAVEEAEQRGFAKGYAEGAKSSQRQAYEEGKASVISKLMGLLA